MLAEILLFLFAGVVGGATNVAAGGAKLFVFPLLLAAGLTPVQASATGTVALWPAQVPGVLVFRDTFKDRVASLALDAIIAGVGAVLGALALVVFGAGPLLTLIPVFLVVSVGAILFGDRIKTWAASRGEAGQSVVAARVLYFVCGMYAGYFGAGLGFLVLASVMAFTGATTHAANARKNLISVGANTAAVVPLALSGQVAWIAAFAVMAGGLAGGYAGARVLKHVPDKVLRYLIAAVGTVLTVTFLIREY